MRHINFRLRKLYRRSIRLISSHLYINPDQDFNNSILIAGTGRSGTTWLGDLIASQIPCRILFEPFNPILVPEYRDFHYFQYMRPGIESPRFLTFANKVFSGNIRNQWVNRQNERILSKYRLIKEIRINLSLKWIYENFPQVPILFIIRHPCAVVLSRKEQGWATDKDIEPFLLQKDLIEDNLSKHLDLIVNKSLSEDEKHAVIWSISNLIPLKQFKPKELNIIFYESLCVNPETELPRIFKTIGHPYNPNLLKKMNRPSTTTRKSSAILNGKDLVSNWKSKMNTTQIDNILRVVEAFGLGHLYGDSIFPLNENAQ